MKYIFSIYLAIPLVHPSKLTSLLFAGNQSLTRNCIKQPESYNESKYVVTEVLEQPGGETRALIYMAIRDQRQVNVNKPRILLANVDVVLPQGMA